MSFASAEILSEPARAERQRTRSRLFRRYVVLLVGLVAGVLIVSGGLSIYFSYQHEKTALGQIQQEKAVAAAAVIRQFIEEIQTQIGWTTQLSLLPEAGIGQRRIDYYRLLRQAPAITEIAFLDGNGKEQLRVSRLAMDVVGSQADFFGDESFRVARDAGVHYGPVYFRRESEPYMRLALRGSGKKGDVTIAEINLKFIRDVISDIGVGARGYAYIVDGQGRLVAHPDLALVLRQTDLAELSQVRDVLAGARSPRGAARIAISSDGGQVLTAHAAISPLDWHVFVETPLFEAFAPLYTTLFWNAGLLLVGLGIAVFASLLLVRSLVGPIRALQEGATRIGRGDLQSSIEIRTGDELEALADDFNRMAARLQESYASLEQKVEERTRELASARQRLVDAIESISEGFAFYDADDRLQLCNTRYRELLYAGTDIEIEPGTSFEAIVRRAVERGLILEAGDDPECYVQQRLAQHRDPGPPTLQHRADGRWILIAERRVTGGGTVAVYSDITELKQREMELEGANRRSQEAAEEIGQKHRELEVLSNKLAKYLSPQVYASIFEGRQEVKLASQRKKLTVFFSDIAGFTETTDRMESEDVTQLLNQYLTEMSRVALEHGATIDKYVGDAIMIFFGDPETRGVKADALACVKMAIAMQKRMRELGAIWRDSGIETPFSCRIGIHTGYCTVGNFGSEDRMDYTIIGGAVNLASRLEHEAPEGGILISYETYAHVKDEIRCEETGRIQVRGIGHSVATYRVVGLHADLARAEPVRADLPHLRLDADLERMSADERRQAAALLQEALQRLGPTAVAPQAAKAETSTEPTPPSGPRRHIRSA
jgi:class 3 adenylate cyclase/HAMP domain-containing protein